MQNNFDLKVIGVTGGIGTGKTTVSKILSGFGGIVIDADEISRKQSAAGGVAYNEIVSYFGRKILSDNGEIDRRKLAEIVFSDNDKLKVINKITHKYVADEIKNRIKTINENFRKKETELNFIVLDVPIPVEEGFFDLSNVIWAVVANNDLRVERIISRLGLTEEEAERRINSQMPNREYMDIADTVIENEKDLETLNRKVAEELAEFFGIRDRLEAKNLENKEDAL